jgi:uncharacterized repeat protein (TIGR01451 family)
MNKGLNSGRGRHGAFRALRVALVLLLVCPWAGRAASLTWNGGVSGDWQNGGGGWLNGLSAATWNNATPDAATFGGTAPQAVNLNAGGVTVGDVAITNGSYTFGGTGILTLNSGALQVGDGLLVLVSNALAGTAGLTKSGAGTLSLVGNNKNYSGTTVLNGGVVQINGAGAGNLGSSSSGNVTFNGGALHTLFSGNTTLNYAFSVGASGGELRNLGTDSQRATLAANKVTGSGTLTLSFGSNDSRIPLNGQSGFSGRWIVDSGGSFNRFVDIQSGAGLGTGTGDDVLTLRNNGKILHRGGTLGGASQGITLGTGTSRVSVAGTTTVLLAGKLSGPASNPLDLDVSTATSTGILSHTSNSFLGDLQLTGPGFVLLGAAGVLPDAGGTVNITNGATLDMNGYSEVVGGLTGNGRADVRVASAAVSLGVGGNNSTSTFAGTITNSAASSSLQLVKVGTGTLILSGTGIGHAGGTIISNGAVEISAAGAGRLGPLASSAVTLRGGTLRGNFSADTTVGNTITVDAAGGTLRNVGGDPGRWTMSANLVYGSGPLTLAFGTQNTRFMMANAQNNFTGRWIVDSGGNVNRFVDLNYASGNGFGAASGDDAITFQNDGAILIRNGLSLGSPSQGITLGSGRAKLSVASTSTGTIAGKISGPVGNHVQFYLDNAGSVLILSNAANSWLGTAQINASAAYGTLRLGAAGVIPDGAGPLEITATARLDMNGYNETIGGLTGAGRVDNLADATTATLAVGGNNSNVTFTGLLTDSGVGATLALTKVGTGTQTLSTAHSYAGQTTVSDGALRISNAGALGDTSAGTVVSSGATLELLGGITLVGESLVLNGTGLGGGGALRNISGNNTWQGAVQLNNTAALTLVSDSGDLKLKGTITQTGGVPPTFQGAGNIFIDGGMNGGFTRGSGAGDVVISKGFTVTGDVTVSASASGAIKLEGALQGNVTMNGGQLTGTGAVQVVTVNGGTIAPNSAAVGRYVMSGLVMTGGAYQWTVTNATGTAGVNWDLLTVDGGSGAVDLSGAGTGAITIRVQSAQAVLPNFDYTAPGSWMLVDAGSVAGFAASKFTVNDSAFTPGSEGGAWSVSTSGGNLHLDFTPGTPMDLAVSASDSPDPVPVGDALTYTITVTNQSAVAASVYYVTNRLDPHHVYVSSSDGGVHNSGVVSWTLANLAANGSKTVTLTVNSPVQGLLTAVSEVWPRRGESDGSDNRYTNRTSAFCPTAGVVTNDAPASLTASIGVPLSFTVAAENADCNAPLLRAAGLPSGATFSVVTSGYSVVGTLAWTPGAAATYPVRFYSYNETKATSTVVTLIHVGAGAQTNWSIEIAGILADSSGNATVVWESVPGITYDLYVSSLPLGGGASWSPIVSGQEALGALSTATVAFAGSMRFYQVVPQGVARTDRGVWGVVRPTIPSAFFMLAPPVMSDLSLADDGELGRALLDGGLDEGTRLHLATDGTPNWQSVEVVGGVWRTDPGGAEYTTPLQAGQAFFIEGAAGKSPTFSGPVGNLNNQSLDLETGYNLVGLSEGRALALNTAFSASSMNPDPDGNNNEDLADQLVIQHSNGTWRRVVRLGNGTWYDMNTRTVTAVVLQPGEACYYLRRNSSSTVSF